MSATLTLPPLERIVSSNGGPIIIDKVLETEFLELMESSFRHARAIANADGGSPYTNREVKAFIQEYPRKLEDFRPYLLGAALQRDENGKLVGASFLASGKPDMPEQSAENCYLFGNYVHPDFLGGLSGNLLAEIITQAEAKGYRKMDALATLFPRTLRFYEKQHFKDLGPEPRIMDMYTAQGVIKVPFGFRHISRELNSYC